MKVLLASLSSLLLPAALVAQDAPLNLPEFSVFSPRVANQEPVGTFAMPVSALRYEPQVDIQGRNLAEGQADVTIRGGIFENTGFRVGGVSLFDPQTGHYFAEIPIAPAMLSAPTVLTGSENALNGFNATVGTIAYDWRRIATRGELTLTSGEYELDRESFYQGYVSSAKIGGYTLAADTEVSHSRSQGSVENGDQRFNRFNFRTQLSSENSQTDLFYGYQAKVFGWPNLYTPFNSAESENLETSLLLLNHRVTLGGDDFVQLAAYYRRNKDDYAFNRFAPLGPIHPFQHTTWAQGTSLTGKIDLNLVSLGFTAEAASDDLKSTSLTFGHFHSRTYYKLAVVPEKTWRLDDARQIVAKAGLTFDDTNRDSSAVSPLFEIALENRSVPNALSRWYLSYAKTTQVPTYTALNSSPSAGLFRGNPDLGRERTQAFELGWTNTRSAWTSHVAIFYRHDDGLVDWTFRQGVTARSADALDLDTVGFEAVESFRTKRFDLILGYTFLNKDSDYRGAIVDASFYALNFAKHRLTAAVVARLGGGWEMRLDNAARVQADNSLRKIGGDETLMSAIGIYYMPPAIRGLELSVAVDNLWNSNFQDVPAVPAARRQISATVAYRW